MEIKVNREIRNYNEAIFLGLSMRQLIFSALAIGVAIGVYFLLRDVMPLETRSWVCILCAAPFGALGFCNPYNGMTAEKILDRGHQASDHPQSIGVPAGKRF